MPVDIVGRREFPVTGFSKGGAVGWVGPPPGPAGLVVEGVGDGPESVTGAGGAATLLISVDVPLSGTGKADPSSSADVLCLVLPELLTSCFAVGSDAPRVVLLTDGSELLDELPESDVLSMRFRGRGIATSSFFSNRGGSCAASVSSETE
ncbi:hypothetical protein ACFRFL_38300 [Streptomyces sp. NPDC056708]|uniref:hypothetical protein n=1 Tax=Streptomyces sp. NPDC056708 TaxID=3345920 RepID=UPI0036A356CE